MKKLKIILLYSFILISIIYIIIINIKKINFSIYEKDTSAIQGRILDYKINGNQLQIKIKAKEKIIVFYTIKTEKEKNFYENNIKIGDIYLFNGTLNNPIDNTNFNLFSYKNYLLSNKIYYTMDANNLILIKKNHNILYKIKNYIHKSIKEKESYKYLLTFLLGDTKEIDTNILTKYRNCGISHLIAISGMHITLFATILSYILKWIKKEYIKLIIIITILWLYAFLIGYTPSVTRAVITFSITNLFKIYNIKIKPEKILILIGICFLIYNPYLIYNAGFLFSYIISFYIILSANIIKKYKNYIIKTFIISIVSFLASIPIIGITFYETNILSPFINILFIPIISYIIFPLSIITYFINILDPIYMFFITILEKIIEICNSYFIYKLTIPHMNIYLIIIYYILLIIIIKYQKKCIIILILFLLLHTNQKTLKNHSIITMIDVGQGDSILIELPYNKENILIDTGGKIKYKTEKWKERENKTITENTLTPFFKSTGIKKINFLILSHGDYDHMGEAINLVNNFKVEKVIFNCGPYNDLEKELIKALDKKHIKYYSCIKELNIDKNRLYFLQTKEYDNENDNSNVIYTELDGYKFMFMGDASVTTEKEILNKYNLSDIDVLKVGHHGSKTSSSKEFIDEINPKYSIISVGKNNRYGHPNKEALSNLADSKIYRTDKDGSIMFKIKNNKLKIETCPP